MRYLAFFVYSTPFVNPLVYTLKMKEFGKATGVWYSSENTASGSEIIDFDAYCGWSALKEFFGTKSKTEMYSPIKVNLSNDWHRQPLLVKSFGRFKT